MASSFKLLPPEKAFTVNNCPMRSVSESELNMLSIHNFLADGCVLCPFFGIAATTLEINKRQKIKGNRVRNETMQQK
jgi:hypothetical protein